MKHTSSITNYLDMETKELFNIYSNDKSNKEVRDILIERNLYLVSILAKKYINKGVEFEDLYQVGSLALIYAIERYDISKGYEFSSFATPTIIGEIKKYFRDCYWNYIDFKFFIRSYYMWFYLPIWNSSGFSCKDWKKDI